MRALSLTQPWAQLMADGRKTYETRSWAAPSSLRAGEVFAIAASKGWGATDRQFARYFGYDPDSLPRGCVVAVANYSSCSSTDAVALSLSVDELKAGDYGEGRYAWRTFGAHKLARPVPCKGALGLWTLPAEVFDAVVAQLEPSLPATVKRVDLFGHVEDTYATEGELNGWRAQQAHLVGKQGRMI